MLLQSRTVIGNYFLSKRFSAYDAVPPIIVCTRKDLFTSLMVPVSVTVTTMRLVPHIRYRDIFNPKITVDVPTQQISQMCDTPPDRTFLVELKCSDKEKGRWFDAADASIVRSVDEYNKYVRTVGLDKQPWNVQLIKEEQ